MTRIRPPGTWPPTTWPPKTAQRAAAWAAGERERVGALFEATAFDTLFVQQAVLGVAPLALVTGAWLQWLNSPANCHDDVALAALTLYASDMHVGSPGPGRGQAFLDLLRATTARRLRVAGGPARPRPSGAGLLVPAAGDPAGHEPAAGRVPARAARRRPLPAQRRGAPGAGRGAPPRRRAPGLGRPSTRPGRSTTSCRAACRSAGGWSSSSTTVRRRPTDVASSRGSDGRWAHCRPGPTACATSWPASIPSRRWPSWSGSGPGKARSTTTGSHSTAARSARGWRKRAALTHCR